MEDWELNTYTMKKYIDGLVKVNTMLHMLQNQLDTGSKTIYPDAMEARAYFQKDTIKKFWDTITKYQAWHQYVTANH